MMSSCPPTDRSPATSPSGIDPARLGPALRPGIAGALPPSRGQHRGWWALGPGRPEITKIAIANPDYAPYGMAARQALQRAGLWSSLESKIVRTDSVRQALIHAQNGDAEVALVSRALAGVPEVRVLEVDPALYDPLIQVLGIVAGRPAAARRQSFRGSSSAARARRSSGTADSKNPDSASPPVANDGAIPAKPSPRRE